MSSVPAIDRTDRRDDALVVWLVGASEALVLPWYWIRDHSRDVSAFDPETRQRRVDTFTIDRGIAPAAVDATDGEIVVSWPDDTPSSVLPASMLAELLPATSPQVLWRDPTLAEVVAIPFDDVMSTDGGFGRWIRSIEVFGFGLVSGVPRGREATAGLARRVGYIRRTVFGDQWTLSTNVTDHADTAYGQATLEPHTDGAYSNDGPGLQLLVCQERSGTGGESVLVDGFAAIEQLRRNDPDAFDLLCDVPVPAHYTEPGVRLRASRPVIRPDAARRPVQITFNNYDRAPFLLPPGRMGRWYDAYDALHALLVDETAWWTRRLEPGDALIFDNWRCLHGRRAFTGTRVFEGCYLNREDFESRVRLLASERS